MQTAFRWSLLGLSLLIYALPATSDACESHHMYFIREYYNTQRLPAFAPLPELPEVLAPLRKAPTTYKAEIDAIKAALHTKTLPKATAGKRGMMGDDDQVLDRNLKHKLSPKQTLGWLLMLGQSDPAKRLVGLWLMKAHRLARRPSFATLLPAMLTNTKPAIRQAAVRLTMNSPQARAKYEQVVLFWFRTQFANYTASDKPESTRIQAYTSLTSFGPKQLGKQDIALLKKGLKDKSLRVQHAALYTLLQLVKDNNARLALLQPRLQHKDLPTATAALCAVSLLGKAAKPLTQTLLRIAAHPNPETKQAALFALFKIGVNNDASGKAFLRAIASKYSDIASIGFRGAYQTNLKASWALAPLKATLYDTKGRLRLLNYRLLLRVQGASKEVMKLILKANQTGSSDVLDATVESLRHAPRPAQELAPLLTLWLQSTQKHQQAAGALLASSLPAKPHAATVVERLFPLVIKHATHSVIEVRALVRKFLFQTTNHSQRVLPLFRSSLRSPYSVIRAQAVAFATTQRAHAKAFQSDLASLIRREPFPKIKRDAIRAYKALYGAAPTPTTAPASRPVATNKGKLAGAWLGHAYSFLMGREMQAILRIQLQGNQWTLTQSNIPSVMFPSVRQHMERIVNASKQSKAFFQLMKSVIHVKDPATLPAATRKRIQTFYAAFEQKPNVMLAIQALMQHIEWKNAPAADKQRGLATQTYTVVAHTWSPNTQSGRITGRDQAGFRVGVYRWFTPTHLRFEVSPNTFPTRQKADAYRPTLLSQSAVRLLTKARYHALLSRPVTATFSKEQLRLWSERREQIAERDTYVRIRQASKPSMGMLRYAMLNGELHQRALMAIGANPYLSIVPMIRAQMQIMQTEQNKQKSKKQYAIKMSTMLNTMPAMPRTQLNHFRPKSSKQAPSKQMAVPPGMIKQLLKQQGQ